jgi:hemoglobin
MADQIHSEATPAQKSLYERLGGVYAIAAVIDDLIDRVMDNPRLNANPKVDEAHHRVSRAGFKYLVTELVCWATGGPQQYTGRSMRDSHVHLDITEEEWQVFLGDVQACLDTFNVPEVEQREIFAIVDSTRSDIVSEASASEPGRRSDTST